jgi:hypothetical protein
VFIVLQNLVAVGIPRYGNGTAALWKSDDGKRRVE